MQLQTIPLDQITLSETPAQKARRKFLDKVSLADLAASIRQDGLINPITVRPTVKGFEVVAGERRTLAAREAGLAEIPAVVRKLDDEETIHVQVVENMQREGLHPLAEAEGYETLKKRFGRSVKEIAKEVGKSVEYVYGRMKLLKLGKAARDKMLAGALTTEIAVEIARIEDEGDQEEAIDTVLYDGMTVREAKDYLRDQYFQKLDKAPFPTDDATLVPKAGACTTCEHRSGAQGEMFGGVKKGDVCRLRSCFEDKKRAQGERLLVKASADGVTVISGDAVKEILKTGTRKLGQGYQRADEVCYDDSKSRTFREIAGKKVTPTLLQDPESGEVIEIISKEDLAGKIKISKEPESSSGHNSWRKEQAAREKKRKVEKIYRLALYAQVRPKLPKKIGRAELLFLAEHALESLRYDVSKDVALLNGWTTKDGKPIDAYDLRGGARIAKFTDAQLIALLFDCTVAGELSPSGYSLGEKPERLLAAAARVKVNAKQVRKMIDAEIKAKKASKSKASKKPARKK